MIAIVGKLASVPVRNNRITIFRIALGLNYKFAIIIKSRFRSSFVHCFV